MPLAAQKGRLVISSGLGLGRSKCRRGKIRSG